MAKTYMLAPDPADDEQKTITVSEIKEVMSESKTTVAQLKQQHVDKLKQIEALKIQADEIVDQLQAINDNLTEITVTDIPAKIVAVTK